MDRVALTGIHAPGLQKVARRTIQEPGLRPGTHAALRSTFRKHDTCALPSSKPR